MVVREIVQDHVAIGDCGRDRISSRDDAIGKDRVVGSTQPFNAVDDDARRSRAADLRAHRVEQRG